MNSSQTSNPSDELQGLDEKVIEVLLKDAENSMMSKAACNNSQQDLQTILSHQQHATDSHMSQHQTATPFAFADNNSFTTDTEP